MKLRIVEKNNKFYCQHRWCFIWDNLTEGYADSYVIRNTLEEAEQYIDGYISQRIIRLSPKKIIKEYTV